MRVHMHSVFVAVCVGLVGLSAIAGSPPPVGLQSAHYEDATRQNWSGNAARPIETLIWYPAADGSTVSDWEVAIFKAGRVGKGAKFVEQPAKLPLIVLSHGTGGSAVGLAWFAQALAAQGYIVAAPNHHGNTGAEDTQPLQGTLVWWDRPRDLSRLLDRLLGDPAWGPRIDASRIGVAGFSIGGYTALATVGARLSRAQWLKACGDVPHDCDLPPEVREKYSAADVTHLLHDDPRMSSEFAHMDDSNQDARIRAAFVMAPAAGPAMTNASLTAIQVPVHIVVGTADDQAVPARNAEPIGAAIPGATVELLPGVTHYSFLPTCNERGNTYVKALCSSPAGIDRDAVHQHVAADALVFFDHSLRASP